MDKDILIPFPDIKLRDGGEIKTWMLGFEAGLKSEEARYYHNGSELKYTTQDIINAVQYGFEYRENSQHDNVSVPVGNILQWIMYKKNLLEIPKEFDEFRK